MLPLAAATRSLNVVVVNLVVVNLVVINLVVTNLVVINLSSRKLWFLGQYHRPWF